MAAVVLVVGLQSLTIVLLLVILKGIHTLMASVQNLQDDLNAIFDEVAVLADEIAALKDAGTQLVSQEQLDALDAKAQAIKAALDAAK